MNKFKHILMGKRLASLAEVMHHRVNWDVAHSSDIEVFIEELGDIHGYLLGLEKDLEDPPEDEDLEKEVPGD